MKYAYIVVFELLVFVVCLLVFSYAFGQQPKQTKRELNARDVNPLQQGLKQIKLKDTDLVSIVMTVKTSRALTAALSGKVLPTQQVTNEAVAALVRAVDGPFMPGPLPNENTKIFGK
jgi:hypothetical protein